MSASNYPSDFIALSFNRNDSAGPILPDESRWNVVGPVYFQSTTKSLPSVLHDLHSVRVLKPSGSSYIRCLAKAAGLATTPLSSFLRFPTLYRDQL